MPVASTSLVSGTTSASAQSATSTTSAASLDANAFLRLLIAEVRNQDPANPIDSSQYVAQLATFSSVEQATQTNAKLDTLLTSLSLSQADSIIGRTITSADGTVSGVASELRIVSGGAVAVLENGSQIELGAGVTVR